MNWETNWPPAVSWSVSLCAVLLFSGGGGVMMWATVYSMRTCQHGAENLKSWIDAMKNWGQSQCWCGVPNKVATVTVLSQLSGVLAAGQTFACLSVCLSESMISGVSSFTVFVSKVSSLRHLSLCSLTAPVPVCVLSCRFVSVTFSRCDF